MLIKVKDPGKEASSLILALWEAESGDGKFKHSLGYLVTFYLKIKNREKTGDTSQGNGPEFNILHIPSEN